MILKCILYTVICNTFSKAWTGKYPLGLKIFRLLPTLTRTDPCEWQEEIQDYIK